MAVHGTAVGPVCAEIGGGWADQCVVLVDLDFLAVEEAGEDLFVAELDFDLAVDALGIVRGNL